MIQEKQEIQRKKRQISLNQVNLTNNKNDLYSKESKSSTNNNRASNQDRNFKTKVKETVQNFFSSRV